MFLESRDPNNDVGEGAAAAGEQEATVEEQAQGVVGHFYMKIRIIQRRIDELVERENGREVVTLTMKMI